jgi:hypothetical protein
MHFDGKSWTTADGRWVWRAGSWHRIAGRGLSGRRRALLTAAIGFTLVGVMAVGSMFIYLVAFTDSQPIASIGGCPGPTVPLPPSSSLDDSAGLVTAWPPRTVGCWMAYSEDGSPNDVFSYYTDGAHIAGWTLVYAYPQTGNARISSIEHRGLEANVSVSDKYHALIGHFKTRLDISVCFCDPDMFLG